MLASTSNSKREMTIVSKDSAFYTRRDRERLGKFIVSFFSAVRFVVYVDEETERENERKKKKEREREREKLEKIIVSFLFVRLFVVYVEEDTVRLCVCVLDILRTVHIREE